MFFKIIITIMLCTFSFADKNYFFQLKNSKHYDKAYEELIKLQNLKDGLFRPWTYTELGLLYEYGNGVKKNHKKAFEAYSTAALYGISYALSKLGYYYHNGIYVKKNRAKAFTYILEAALKGDAYGMYLAGLYYKNGFSVVEKNPIAAKKWLQKAAQQKSYAKKLLSKSTFDTNAQIKKRKAQINNLSKDKSLFGITLKEPLYPELALEESPDISFAYTYSWYENSLSKSLLSIYTPNSEKKLLNKLYSKINVYTTPVTNSVYEIDGFFNFGSQGSCKSELTNFLQNIQAETNEKIALSKFYRKKSLGHYYEYRYLDIGVYSSPTSSSPDIIEDVKKLQGTRFIVKCFDDGKGELRVINFPTFELRLAESIQKDLFFSYLGKKRILPTEYMKPFGVNLLAPLPKSLHVRKTKNKNTFLITPAKPLKNLTKYEVTTSKLTKSVISVKAEGEFKDKSTCQIAMGTTAQKLYEHYTKSKKTLNWYKAKYSNPNNLFVEYCLTPRGLKTTCPNDFKYTIYGKDYSPSIQNVQIHIACDGKKGVLQVKSQYGVQMAQKESELLFTHKER
jgi:hypothetical protein